MKGLSTIMIFRKTSPKKEKPKDPATSSAPELWSMCSAAPAAPQTANFQRWRGEDVLRLETHWPCTTVPRGKKYIYVIPCKTIRKHPKLISSHDLESTKICATVSKKDGGCYDLARCFSYASQRKHETEIHREGSPPTGLFFLWV